MRDLVQISTKEARKLFNKGNTIWLLPSRLNVNNPYFLPIAYNRKVFIELGGSLDFDCLVTNFKYLNCNTATGLHVSFYKGMEE